MQFILYLKKKTRTPSDLNMIFLLFDNITIVEIIGAFYYTSVNFKKV